VIPAPTRKSLPGSTRSGASRQSIFLTFLGGMSSADRCLDL
jgi:hypothetical protein